MAAEYFNPVGPRALRCRTAPDVEVEVGSLDETITVLKLDGDAYAEHGVFRRGGAAASALLEGFAVPVDEVFDAA